MKNTKTAGFTLVEILVVIGVLAVLAAILLPAFASVRAGARAASCSSNLRQLGQAMTLYTTDWDRYPRGLDPADKATPQIWNGEEAAQGVDFAAIQMLPDVMESYARERDLWRCPSDSGFDVNDITGVPLDARPTSFKKFGMSYFYRTEVTLLNLAEERLARPSETHLLSDGDGGWHGAALTNLWRGKRYNVLFADGHTKNLSADAFDETWRVSLK